MACVVVGRPCAGDVQFPSDAGVIDVTQPPYDAVGDGRTDDTVAIQQALDAHPSGNRIIYLPNGTYLVSDQLRWPPSTDERSRSGSAHKRTILQGQSRDGVVIRLTDNADGFQTRTVVERKGRTKTYGRGVIWTGTAPAQRFRNAVRDLTVNIGSGNPAASGLQFHANNQGTIRNVSVVSEDGQGFCGFDFGFTGEIGPLLARNISVRGFDYGIYHAALNMVTFENVALTDQNVAAIYNTSVMPIRNLTVNGKVTAVESAGNDALVMLNAELSGNGGPAFTSVPKRYFLRDVNVAGYDVQFADSGDGRDDSVSHEPVRLASTESDLIGLAVKESPNVRFDPDFDHWANPLDYGAVGDGKADDTEAIQAAIDDRTKTTVYLPGGRRFRIEGELAIRGNIERLIGCEGSLRGASKRPARIVVADGIAPTVIVERIDCGYGDTTFAHATSRKVVISSICGLSRVESNGTGDFFVDDVVCGPVVMSNPQQSIWMRQINTESKHDANLQNRGATLWVLGHKTENGNTKVLTTSGGRTEIYGAHIYANQKEATPYPLFVVKESQMTAVGIRQTFWPPKTKPFDVLLRETRDGAVRELTAEDNPTRYSLPMLISR